MFLGCIRCLRCESLFWSLKLFSVLDWPTKLQYSGGWGSRYLRSSTALGLVDRTETLGAFVGFGAGFDSPNMLFLVMVRGYMCNTEKVFLDTCFCRLTTVLLPFNPSRTLSEGFFEHDVSAYLVRSQRSFPRLLTRYDALRAALATFTNRGNWAIARL
jgi:hypothetical protein